MKKHEQLGLIDGKPEESILSGPGMWGTLEARDRPELYAKAVAPEDDRLFALMCSMVVENRLERLLKAWLPDFSGRGTSFYQRCVLLKQARLIPLHIIEAADLVRDVRNGFAHNINLDECANLEEPLQQRLRQFRHDMTGEDGAAKTARENLQFAAFVAQTGFDSYAPIIKWMNRHLRSDDFRAFTQVEGKKAFDAFVAEMKAKGPKAPHPDDPAGVIRYASPFGGDHVYLGPDVKNHTVK